MRRLSLHLFFLTIMFSHGIQFVSGQNTNSSSQAPTFLEDIRPEIIPEHISKLLIRLDASKLNNDTQETVCIQLELAFSFYKSKQYDLARNYFRLINDQSVSLASEKDLLWSKLGLGLVHYDLSEYQEALNIFETCNQDRDTISDDTLQSYISRYLSLCYLNIGNNKEAEKWTLDALKYAPESEIPFLQNELIRILFYLDKRDDAMKLARSNLELFMQSGDSFGICIAYTSLGQILYQIGEETEALEAWGNCFSLALEKKEFEALVWISNTLYRHYRRTDEKELALRYIEYNTLYKDSINLKNSRIELAFEAARTKTLQKQQELSLLAKEKDHAQAKIQRNKLLMAAISTLLLLVLALLLLFRYRSKTKEQNLTLELNRMRLNPHFIFNSLNSLQKSMIQEDFEASNRYLTKFARLMRETLDQSMESFIPLSREISFLENYLDLENLRFNNKFSFQIKLDHEVDESDVLIPSMLIQPIVENSIWHGLLPLEGAGNIEISFSWNETGNLIKCEISDNGIGRKKAESLKSENSGPYTSKGTKILKTRISIMRKLFHSRCTLEYYDLQNNNGEPIGTRAVLILPTKN
ncbi:MAG: histidine kinase [Bacteroidetes bacterium]|nr:histidine kinase [Bacteroidota bacterium]